MHAQLRILTAEPKHIASCCASLSTFLLQKLSDLLPRAPAVTLSIGSGSGVLEALLLQHEPGLRLEGVEVSADVNHYLREESLHVVSYSGAVCARAAEAEAWMFVYPRSQALIEEYLRMYGAKDVRVIIFILPREDVAALTHPLSPLEHDQWSGEVVLKAGLADWEAIICYRRTMP